MCTSKLYTRHVLKLFNFRLSNFMTKIVIKFHFVFRDFILVASSFNQKLLILINSVLISEHVNLYVNLSHKKHKKKIGSIFCAQCFKRFLVLRS